LIDTLANENYISHKLCDKLQRYSLQESHRYTNFNEEIHEIDKEVETILKFGTETIPLRLLIEGFNDTIEIMLGITI
jgi:hypothetical protein